VKITRSGLTLNNSEGHWITEDGEWEILRFRATTYCDSPHPTRKEGYCRGNGEHDVAIGWGIESPKRPCLPHGSLDDVFQTRDEAISVLAKYLAATIANGR
jgi:hypothetical protein